MSGPPSREQFDAAVERVMQNAPSGLSEAQFFDLVDKEINRQQGPIPAADQLPAQYPSTGGFLKNVFESAVDVPINMAKGVAGLAKTAVTKGPQEVPMEIAAGIGNRLKMYATDPLAMMYHDPMGVAADVAGVGGMARLGMKAATGGNARGVVAGSPDVRAMNTVRKFKDQNPPTRPAGPITPTSPPAGLPGPGSAPSRSLDGSMSRLHDITEEAMQSRGLQNMEMPEVTLSPDDLVFDGITEELGGTTPPAVMSPESLANVADPYMAKWGSGEWHSGATPGSPEARAAQSRHVDEAYNDMRYRQKIGDEKGNIINPMDVMGGAALEYLLRKAGVGGMAGTAGRNAGKLIPRIPRPPMPSLESIIDSPLSDLSVISRFANLPTSDGSR